jgi:hypothetical protein
MPALKMSEPVFAVFISPATQDAEMSPLHARCEPHSERCRAALGDERGGARAGLGALGAICERAPGTRLAT